MGFGLASGGFDGDFAAHQSQGCLGNILRHTVLMLYAFFQNLDRHLFHPAAHAAHTIGGGSFRRLGVVPVEGFLQNSHAIFL